MLTVGTYHYIRNDFSAPFPSIFGVTPDAFRQQLKVLGNEGTFISPIQFAENSNDILRSKENYLLITFDDGLKEQYENAVPILEELDIPAIFFINSINHIEKQLSLVHKIHLVRSVISSFVLLDSLKCFTRRELNALEIEKAHHFYRFDSKQDAELKYFLNVLLDLDTQRNFINDIFSANFEEKVVIDQLYMNTDEIRKLSRSGFIGSHTHSHLPLGIYNEQIIKYELEATKKYLEEIGGRIVNFVSYPYGAAEAVNDLVAKLAMQAGYEFGFTTNPDTNFLTANNLLLNRFDCNDLMGGKNFKSSI
jgi:peptidoglycan/xylan/chitin deacetylase (PgdA/CDA1 family)